MAINRSSIGKQLSDLGSYVGRRDIKNQFAAGGETVAESLVTYKEPDKFSMFDPTKNLGGRTYEYDPDKWNKPRPGGWQSAKADYAKEIGLADKPAKKGGAEFFRYAPVLFEGLPGSIIDEPPEEILPLVDDTGAYGDDEGDFPTGGWESFAEMQQRWNPTGTNAAVLGAFPSINMVSSLFNWIGQDKDIARAEQFSGTVKGEEETTKAFMGRAFAKFNYEKDWFDVIGMPSGHKPPEDPEKRTWLERLFMGDKEKKKLAVDPNKTVIDDSLKYLLSQIDPEPNETIHLSELDDITVLGEGPPVDIEDDPGDFGEGEDYTEGPAEGFDWSGYGEEGGESWDIASGGALNLKKGGGLSSLKPQFKGELNPGDFVLSADVVSGIGDGSSEAGVERIANELSIETAPFTAAYGGEVRGPGSGLDDRIQTSIKGKQAARLSRQEFLVPRQDVLKIGNGSLRKGQEMLYTLMDGVRNQKSGGTQPDQLKGSLSALMNKR